MSQMAWYAGLSAWILARMRRATICCQMPPARRSGLLQPTALLPPPTCAGCLCVDVAVASCQQHPHLLSPSTPLHQPHEQSEAAAVLYAEQARHCLQQDLKDGLETGRILGASLCWGCLVVWDGR